MTEIETAVARHYTTGALIDRIDDALHAIGITPETATVADLKSADEFHTAGVLATDHLFAQLNIPNGARVLDIGAGIGGTARYVADRFGAHVTGVDLTPEFVETARTLSLRVGFDDKTAFHVGSALSMPVPDAGFDFAILMHVGMNIADKPALMAEIARTLKPGGSLALFEVMKGPSDDPLQFPLPWSEAPETSFVDAPEVYRDSAAASGLTLAAETDRTSFAVDFFRDVFARTARNEQSPLGIHLMMGDTAPLKFRNYLENVEAGRLRPTEMIFAKSGT